MDGELTGDLTEEIAAAGNTYRWKGTHRPPKRHSLRRGFFVGTAAGTGLVIAAIAFPFRTRPEQVTAAASFMDPPTLAEPEPEHVDPDDCPVCIDPIRADPPPPVDHPPVDGPTSPPVRVDLPAKTARHRAPEVLRPIVVVTPTAPAEPDPDPVIPEPAPADDDPSEPPSPPKPPPGDTGTPEQPEAPCDDVSPPADPVETEPVDPTPPPMPPEPEDTDDPAPTINL